MSNRYPGQATKSVLMNFRVTPEVADRIRGLAWYLKMPYSEMLVLLEAEKRQQLYAENKRPPLRPPAATDGQSLQVSDSRGPKTPRR